MDIKYANTDEIWQWFYFKKYLKNQTVDFEKMFYNVREQIFMHKKDAVIKWNCIWTLLL